MLIDKLNLFENFFTDEFPENQERIIVTIIFSISFLNMFF